MDYLQNILVMLKKKHKLVLEDDNDTLKKN